MVRTQAPGDQRPSGATPGGACLAAMADGARPVDRFGIVTPRAVKTIGGELQGDSEEIQVQAVRLPRRSKLRRARSFAEAAQQVTGVPSYRKVGSLNAAQMAMFLTVDMEDCKPVDDSEELEQQQHTSGRTLAKHRSADFEQLSSTDENSIRQYDNYREALIDETIDQIAGGAATSSIQLVPKPPQVAAPRESSPRQQTAGLVPLSPVGSPPSDPQQQALLFESGSKGAQRFVSNPGDEPSEPPARSETTTEPSDADQSTPRKQLTRLTQAIVPSQPTSTVIGTEHALVTTPWGGMCSPWRYKDAVAPLPLLEPSPRSDCGEVSESPDATARRSPTVPDRPRSGPVSTLGAHRGDSSFTWMLRRQRCIRGLWIDETPASQNGQPRGMMGLVREKRQMVDDRIRRVTAAKMLARRRQAGMLRKWVRGHRTNRSHAVCLACSDNVFRLLVC